MKCEKFTASEWKQTAKLSASDGGAYQFFGFAVALSASTALIGAINAPVDGRSGEGAVYVFENSNGNWTQTAKLTASDGGSQYNFGSAIAVSASTAVIGARFASVSGHARQGAAYIFKKVGGHWTQVAKLAASDALAGNLTGSLFGSKVDVSGNTAIVGAWSATVDGNARQGTAYVFDESNGSWTQAAKLIANDGTASQYFGFSVALSGKTAFVGAYGTAVNTNAAQGALYIFSKTKGWAQTGKLTARGGAPNDSFGSSVALSGTTLIVGADGVTHNGNHLQGAVYLFDKSNGIWQQTGEFIAKDGETGDHFGGSIAVAGPNILIGAAGGNAVYLYIDLNFGLTVSAPAAVSATDTYTSQTFVTNDSSVSAPAVIATVGVPATATFISATATQGSCAEASRVVTCNFGPIAGNAGEAIASVKLKAPANDVAPLVLENTATLPAAAGPDLTASVPVAVNLLPADLSLSGSVSPIGPVAAGDSVAYTVTVQNLSDAEGAATAIKLAYEGPKGVQFQAANGATCVPSSAAHLNQAVCVLGTIYPNQSKVVKISVLATAAASSISGTFNVSSRAPQSGSGITSLTLNTDSSVGPPGPTGPQGPKGDKGGSGGMGLGGLAFLGLLVLVVGVIEIRKRRLRPQGDVIMSRVATIRNIMGVAAVSAGFLTLSLPVQAAGARGPSLAGRVVQKTVRSGSRAMDPGLRAAYYHALAKDGGIAYDVDKAGCATLTRGVAFKACFGRDGAHFAAGSSDVGLHLAAWGRAGELSAVQSVKPHVNGKRVSYVHGGLIEWWQVLQVGFEQGFTVTRRPAGAGQLVLALAANEEVSEYSGGALGWGHIRYGELEVSDAEGRAVPATLKSEGNRILIAINDAHATYPLTVDPLVWLAQKVTDANGTIFESFGYPVAVSGKTAVVGAGGATVNGNPHQGAAFVFRRSNGIWKQTAEITASDGKANDRFGDSVAIAGTTVLVGAPRAATSGNANEGAAYVFVEAGDGWTQTAKLTPTDGSANYHFGNSIAVSGLRALIAAPGASVNGNAMQGAAYVFEESNGNWAQTAKLTVTGGQPYSQLGSSVALSGATAVVGEISATVGTNAYQGAAYVFEKSNGNWTQTAELTAGDGKPFDEFGNAVAVSGSVAIVGAVDATVGTYAYQGAAYVFEESNGGWTQTAKLVAGDEQKFQSFGGSVALSGTSVAIGAYGTTVNGNGAQGAVYLFDESNGSWTQTAELTAKDGEANALFGQTVALDGATVLIGAPSATIGSNTSQGAAYFMSQSDLDFVVSAPVEVSAAHAYKTQTIATNSSSVGTPAVSATIAVPAAVSFISATATQGSCAEASRVVTCDFGSIAGNAGEAIASVKLKAPANGVAPATIEHTATLQTAPPLTASASTRINLLPVDLDLSGYVTPTGPVHENDNLSYTLVVQNLPDANGAAPRIHMIYVIPQGVTYLGSSGVACASLLRPPGSGAAAAPIAASVVGPFIVSCDFGMLYPNQAKLATITVRATSAASSISGSFAVRSDAPQRGSGKTDLTLVTNPSVGATGPTGPTGPAGPQGPKGSGSFGWLALAALLGLGVATIVQKRRRRN